MAYEATGVETILAGGRLVETRRVFEFEADFASDLRCIPMAVRFKLDRCGVKLSLKQWSRIGAGQRFALADRACDTANEALAYRATLLGLIEGCDAGEAILLPLEKAPAWADTSQVPPRIGEMIAALGLKPISVAVWTDLPVLWRFALLKLTRPGHDNDNFLPAIYEFGLCQ